MPLGETAGDREKDLGGSKSERHGTHFWRLACLGSGLERCCQHLLANVALISICCKVALMRWYDGKLCRRHRIQLLGRYGCKGRKQLHSQEFNG